MNDGSKEEEEDVEKEEWDEETEELNRESVHLSRHLPMLTEGAVCQGLGGDWHYRASSSLPIFLLGGLEWLCRAVTRPWSCPPCCLSASRRPACVVVVLCR